MITAVYNLYNIIRDFFVTYIFGGYNSSGSYISDCIVGSLILDNGDGTFTNDVTYTNDLVFDIGGLYFDGESTISTYISIGDWLSTTATIITLVALFVGIALLTIKLFKIVSNIIALR